MPDGFVRASAARLLAVTVLCAGCASQQDVIQRQQDKLESLGATTKLIAEDWLAGSVSSTYARTALDQTFRQVEQQHTALVGNSEMLLDPRAA
jgi:hypothetical protein